MPDHEDLNQKELATRLGISPRAVRDLHGHGIPHERDGRELRYPWPKARHWYIEFKQDERDRRRGEGRELKLQDEKARETAAKADIAEAKAAIMVGELLHISEVADRLAKPLKQVDATLKNAPSRHAAELAKLAGIKTAPAMKLLEQIIEEVRSDLRRIRETDE